MYIELLCIMNEEIQTASFITHKTGSGPYFELIGRMSRVQTPPRKERGYSLVALDTFFVWFVYIMLEQDAISHAIGNSGAHTCTDIPHPAIYSYCCIQLSHGWYASDAGF